MKVQYPKHFYDPLRIEIAVRQIQHDVRKLFPSLSEEELKKIDQDIAGWPKGERFEMEAIHDFWNFFGDFSRGLKLKSLLFWITAENVQWRKADIPVRDAILTWNFPGFEFMGKSPYKISHVLEKLALPHLQHHRRELIKDSDFRSQRFAPRDHFSIIAFHDREGDVLGTIPGYYTFEGNRRVVRAMLAEQPTIQAYVGVFSSSESRWPENYWIRTGILFDLVFLAHAYNLHHDREAFSIVRRFYQLLLRDSDISRIATFSKVFKYIERDEDFMRSLFQEEMP